MSTPVRPLPLSSHVCDLYAVHYPQYVEYATYTRGVDLEDPECVLELTHELHEYFDREFSPQLLTACLQELKPRVLLLPAPAQDRTDWPWLEDSNLERVVEWCENRQYQRPNPLHALATMLQSSSPLGGVRKPLLPCQAAVPQTV